MKNRLQRALVYLISIISMITIAQASYTTMSFKELTRLASEDLAKNIYLEK